MKDETKEAANDLIELIDNHSLPVEVTQFDIIEYHRGDPTTEDSVVTGGEIDLNCVLTLDGEPGDEDDNPYRVK